VLVELGLLEQRHKAVRRLVTAMSMSPEPLPAGAHLELSVEEQLGRAKPWVPGDVPVFDDLTDEEEAEFLAAIADA
jgi:hypothetical protein